MPCMDYRQSFLEEQRYFKGELRFRNRMKEAELEGGFDPEFDPDLGMGIDPHADVDFQIMPQNSSEQSQDYFAREDKEECEEKERQMWRSMPDYTELYYDFYHSITLEEAEEIEEHYAYRHDDDYDESDDLADDNMVNMLLELEDELEELEAAEEDRRRYPPLEPEEDDWGDMLVRQINPSDRVCENLWRQMPGFTELYYDLYCTMTRKEVTRLINECLDIKLPFDADWNTISMLDALEKEGMELECIEDENE